MIGENCEIPIISGDQCGYWDAPIKIGVLAKFFPKRKIRHFIHDADAVGVPTKEHCEKMISENKEYDIGEESVNAAWTSGFIFVPSRDQVSENKEFFTGIISSTRGEILASLNGSAEIEKIIYSSGVNWKKTPVGKNYFETTLGILEDWADLIGEENNSCSYSSTFNYFTEKKNYFLRMAESWNSEKTKIYNHYAKMAEMVNISSSKGEVPFFFAIRENGKIVRKKVYLRKGEWLECVRKMIPIKIKNVLAIIPKALILAIFVRSQGNVAVMKTGSGYMKQSALLAKNLGIRQFPIIRISIDWKGFSRPFIGWIYSEEGEEGIKKIIKNASVEFEE